MKIRISLALVLAFCFISSSFAQPKKIYVTKSVLTVRSAPAFTLQFDLHYNQPIAQFSGTYNDDFRSDEFINGRSLGANKGYGASLLAKISSPNPHIRFTFSAAYNRMQTYFFSKAELADEGESKFNLFTGGIGLENSFTPNHKVKLYVGAEAIFSMINGKAHIWVENKPNTPYTYDIKIKDSYRLGAALFGGAEYMVSNEFGFNIGFKLSHANLLLKEAKETGDPNEINLIDDDNKSEANQLYAGKKQIAFLSIVSGINIYWGVAEKKYILSK